MQFDECLRVGKIWNFWKILEVAAATFPSCIKFLSFCSCIKNLTIPAAAHSQLIRSCIENLTAGARSICTHERHNWEILEWKFLEENFAGRFWKNWEKLGFRRTTSKLDVTRLKEKEEDYSSSFLILLNIKHF